MDLLTTDTGEFTGRFMTESEGALERTLADLGTHSGKRAFS